MDKEHGGRVAIPNVRSRIATVEIERTEDGVIVADPETGVYGLGDTPDEAFHDFMDALAEYRDILLKASPNISERLAAHLQLLLATLGN